MSDQRTDDLIIFFDMTLGDGGQIRGVDFTAADKQFIAQALDDFGIEYTEGNWPGGNPTDDMFFSNDRKLKNVELVAFGITRRRGRSIENDPGLDAILDARTNATCLVGKTSDFHVTTALNIDLDENLQMISETVASVKAPDARGCLT